MDVIINLDTFKIGLFIAALLLAVLATLDLIRISNFSKYLKMSPEIMLICSVALLIVPTLSALGNAISEFLGDILPGLAFLFFIATGIIHRRDQRESAHNESLNTDASDTGAG